MPSGALNRLESGRRDTGIRGTSDGPNGFFDIANRYAGLDAKNDPLVKIDEVVPWEDFRPRLEAAGASRPRTGSLRRDASRGIRW